MKSMLPFALDYASRYGWAVHPVGIDKHPTTLHGFKDATRDETIIRGYFKNGAQLSIATGEASGVLIFDVDIDPEKGIDGHIALAELEATHGPLPRTPRQRTGRGGEHYFFKHIAGVRNSTSKIGHGIDIRAEGGYAVVAPSRNENGAYEWIVSPDETPIVDAPGWLVDLLTAEPERPAPRPVAPALRNLSPYIEQAFRNEIANVVMAPDGIKHDVLRDAGIKLGTLIAHGLDEQAAIDALYNAILGRAEDPDNAYRTILAGIAYGKARPREIPDRPRATSDRPRSGSDQPSDQQVIAPRFTIAREDALMDLPPVSYLDRDLGLVAQAFHLIYGASGSGKTFFAVERAMRQVALGRRVLYIATEDIRGLRYRIVAWRRANPGASGRLTWLQMPVGLDLQDHNQVAELIEAIEPYEYDHIVLDTLREAHSGDENSSQDTQRINRAIQRLMAAGAAMDVVHHTGVNGERPRGSTALFGNADAVIKVEDDDGYIRITFDKWRVASPRDSILFGLMQQDTGLTDTDGEPVISAVLRPANQTTRRDAKISPIQRKVLATLALSIFEGIGAKSQQVIDTAEVSRRNVYLALAALKTRGYISQGDKGDPYMITPAGRAQLGSDLVSSPSQSASDQSDQQVITSDQRTSGSEVITSDHTRRVITGSHTRTSDTEADPAYRVIPAPPMEVNMRLRWKEQEAQHLADLAAQADEEF